jgi:hypothetical protein
MNRQKPWLYFIVGALVVGVGVLGFVYLSHGGGFSGAGSPSTQTESSSSGTSGSSQDGGSSGSGGAPSGNDKIVLPIEN